MKEVYKALCLQWLQVQDKIIFKGYVAIKNKFGKILTQKEFNDWVKLVHKKQKDDFVNRCRGFYESKEFVEKDQYNLFNEWQSKILTSWNELAEEELAAKSLVKK